ncbi:centrosomal protein of 63 kDa [Vespula squamosa]|uniref:Cilia- and flagella-associated protein 157 n=1 Tax=Vespula squamosa TaxID=30214 RepID=A0ABD1ZVJ8_VESSQ
MQKEMEERLHELAEKFREATNIRIADTTHRAVRENIILNQELDMMMEFCRELHSNSMDYKEAVKMLKLKADLLEAEKNITLNKTIKQKHIITNLAEDCNIMTDKYIELKRLNNYLFNHTAILEKCKEESITAEKKIRILEQNLQKIKESKTQILGEIHSKQQEFNNLNQTLQEAKQCIMEALQLQEKMSAEDVCSSCYIDLKEEVLSSLLNILKKQFIPSISSHHISQQEEDIECYYEKGSLGLLQTIGEDEQSKYKSVGIEKERKQESLPVPEKISSPLLDDSSNVISPSSSINHVHEII